jgi:hypothetical protein
MSIKREEAPLAGFIADHIQYIKGYPTGTVGPDEAITRAETSVIFFRLLNDESKDNYCPSAFVDVPDAAWYAQAVNYMVDRDLIFGYYNGEFRPDNPITRAEFAAWLAGFDNLERPPSDLFNDIDGHWAADFINSAAAKGWISGYPDGSFRPESRLLRAEIVTVINKMLDRMVDGEDIPEWAPPFIDIDAGHWAYPAIMEASVTHEFVRKDQGDYESWTNEYNIIEIVRY